MGSLVCSDVAVWTVFCAAKTAFEGIWFYGFRSWESMPITALACLQTATPGKNIVNIYFQIASWERTMPGVFETIWAPLSNLAYFNNYGLLEAFCSICLSDVFLPKNLYCWCLQSLLGQKNDCSCHFYHDALWTTIFGDLIIQSVPIFSKRIGASTKLFDCLYKVVFYMVDKLWLSRLICVLWLTRQNV